MTPDIQLTVEAQIRTIIKNVDEYADAFFQGAWGTLHLKNTLKDLVESLPALRSIEIQLSSLRSEEAAPHSVIRGTIEQRIQRLVHYRAGECTNFEFNHMYRTVVIDLSNLIGKFNVRPAA